MHWFPDRFARSQVTRPRLGSLVKTSTNEQLSLHFEHSLFFRSLQKLATRFTLLFHKFAGACS